VRKIAKDYVLALVLKYLLRISIAGMYSKSFIVLLLLLTSEHWTVMFKYSTASVVYWSEFLATDPEARVRFQALPHFLRSSEFGTGSTQPREYN
jgi:hypothetical protein